ncbi:MAG: potassium-transporting ATPase subunit KdpC [bacterium]
MGTAFYRSIVVTLLLALLLCVIYPLAVTGVGKVFFNHQANGSLILKDGQVIGSEWIGQNFSRPEYFHPRPSAAGNGYDAANSSGTNLGPTNPKLVENLKANLKKVQDENPGVAVHRIPVDLVTASASGLDPHISPEGADLQVERVAKARNLSAAQVRELLQQNTDGPQWGLFGEPGVNVLKLNYALDKIAPMKTPESKPEAKTESAPQTQP